MNAPTTDQLRLWLRHFVTGSNMRKQFNVALASGFRPEQLREFRDVCLWCLNPDERAMVERAWTESEASESEGTNH